MATMNKLEMIYVLKELDRWDEFNPWDVVGYVTTLEEADEWCKASKMNGHRCYEIIRPLK